MGFVFNSKPFFKVKLVKKYHREPASAGHIENPSELQDELKCPPPFPIDAARPSSKSGTVEVGKG